MSGRRPSEVAWPRAGSFDGAVVAVRTWRVLVGVALVLGAVGCGATPAPRAADAPSMPVRGTATVKVGDREVTLHVPDSYRPETPAPLVITLHGYTSSGAQQESYFRFTAESDRRGFVYAYPDGLPDSRNDRFWNATDACCDFSGARPDDSGYLSKVIETIQGAYRIDARRVYLVGHSNGAFMAYRMACDHADQVTAIAALNGAMWQDASRCRPSGPVSVLDIHGTADETILPAGGSLSGHAYPSAATTVADWLGFDRCAREATAGPRLDLVPDLPAAETAVARYTAGCAGGSTVQTWTVEGGGHVPRLGPDFAPAVVDFLLSRAKP
jgi:polyhydroxybutyrate depolymerase